MSPLSKRQKDIPEKKRTRGQQRMKRDVTLITNVWVAFSSIRRRTCLLILVPKSICCCCCWWWCDDDDDDVLWFCTVWLILVVFMLFIGIHSLCEFEDAVSRCWSWSSFRVWRYTVTRAITHSMNRIVLSTKTVWLATKGRSQLSEANPEM